MSSPIKTRILVPGRSQVAAAEALESPRRLVGKWPYQWLFPGPNSRLVGLLIGVILIVGGLTFFPAVSLGPVVEQLVHTRFF